jgi:hypothetical protein
MSAIAGILAAAILTFIGSWFWFARNQKVHSAEKDAAIIQKLVDRITELERQQSVLGSTVLPISTAFQAILIKELTHFHTPEMDALMVKMGPPYTLTLDEERRLVRLLNARQEDMHEDISDSERDAALMLPLLMKRVKNETATLKELALVVVPKSVLETGGAMPG